MLTLLDNAGTYQLPTSWREVSTAHWCALAALPFPNREAAAGIFAGRPIQVNGLVADVLAFLDSEPPTDGGLPYPSDLGQETFLQVETIRALLTARPLHACLLHVWAAFIARKWNFFPPHEYRQDMAVKIQQANADVPITQVYPAVRHCLSEMERLAAKYAYLSQPDTTEAGKRAREAGADRLNALGHYNTAAAYAKDFHLTLEAAYQAPWENVAIWLYQQRLSAEIQDTLQQNSNRAHE